MIDASFRVRSEVFYLGIDFADNLLRKIESFERLHHAKPLLDEKKIRKLKKLLIKHNQPALTHILEQYGISNTEIISGVQCPNCLLFGMKWISCSWSCLYCQAISKTTHIKTIEEYLLLNHSMTNQQCKDFINLSSPDMAYRFIKLLNLPYNGNNKGRKYYLDLKQE